MKSLLLKYKPVARIKFSLTLILSLFSVSNCFAQPLTDYPIIRTPETVSVNKELPKNILPNTEAIPVSFSKNPTDEEIYAVHFFEEPLVPAKGTVSSEENKALVYALAAYSQRTSPDDFTALTGFLNQFPKSRWQGALLADMGIVYRRTGYYSMAMEAWEKSWLLLKDEQEAKVKVLADRVISELLMINSWVGRVTRMQEIVNEIEHRIMQGPATERVSAARSALIIMKARPGVSYKCGPFALEMVSRKDTGKIVFNKKIFEIQSPLSGFALSELDAIARDNGMKYQMAFRKPGAPIILKAVVHWKLNHYSALLKHVDGHLMCEDVTLGTMYGKQFWLTPTALDSSASGYFMVPEGPLPEGWRKVTLDEGAKIFGKGNEIPDNGKHVTDDDPELGGPCPPSTPMAQSNVHAVAVSLHIYDRPAYYTPPKGPAMLWDVNYHHRDSYQPANFTYSNMGPKWTFRWLSYVSDDPNNQLANADLYAMGGGVRTFVSFDTVSKSFAPEVQTNDKLIRTCPNCYEVRHPDGSKEVYARSDGNTSAGRKIFLTKKIDAAGNEMNLTYDANLRVTSLKDALNQVTTLTYGIADIYKITQVTDPFGRSASFQYDASGRLISITDMIGIVSSFQYNASDFVNNMTTPYGTTSFIADDMPGIRSVETHYPLGEKERVEYRENAPGIVSSEDAVPSNAYNGYLIYRNTFFWDRNAMKIAPGDYTKAEILHWLHGSYLSGENGVAAPILESVKKPLERRQWYSYQGQTSGIFANQGMSGRPSVISRILDDGTEQTSNYTYNDLGKVLTSKDPSGRRFTYIYDSTKINLIEVRQTRGAANELLAKYTYNTKYLPLTSTNASGLVTTYTYNAAGQLLTVKSPKNEITTLTYNASGFLTGVAGPVAGSTTTIAYDTYGRVKTITDPDGYVVKSDYDVLDRPTVVTYPDNTFEQFVYDRLDAVHYRDRLGRWSHNVYDSLRRQSVAIDALGRLTQYIWCSCGSLSEIIDPLKNITSFTRDLQGRIVNKTYNTGKTISYVYENTTSRLKQETDAKGQKKNYTYYIDNNLKSVSYLYAITSTRGISYTYDTNYNRVKTMMDGLGTTVYAYKSIGSGLGAGRLGSVDGPLPNDLIAYNYDSLGRVTSRSINGVGASVVYDKLNRIISETNALGNFGYSFVNQSGRVAAMTYPNGQSVVYDYNNNANDQRSKQIWNRNASGTTLSKFAYEYTKVGQISKWTQQTDSTDINYDELTYDLADELFAATKKNLSPASIIRRYAYQYDQAGNRTNEQIDNTVTSASFNSLNQLSAQQNGGSVRVKGSLNELSSVKVKNLTSGDSIPATVDSIAKTFEGFIKVIPGSTNIIQIIATDFSGNANTRVINDTIATGNGLNNTIVVDLNGNTVSSSNPAVTYGWDAENRLVKINKGNAITEFVYDGLGRRVGEKLNGTFIKRWLWCGSELCEERDGSGGTVTKRFFQNGEQIAGVNYYFTKDHLGSIREMTNSSGVVQARYTYDPYGRRTKLSGSLDADFGFTGHYYHTSSGLNLAMYRAYDASVGRWLNRDPAQEKADINLYRYVGNNPVGYVDPTGLWTFGFGGTASGGLGGGGTIAVGLYIGHNSNAGFFSGWSIDFQGTLGGGGFIGGGGSAGGFVAVTDADCTGQLTGKSVSLGASGGEGISAGGDIVTGLDDNGRPTYGGLTLNAGVGGGLPVEAHGFLTNTWGVADLFR